jgi:hypothetical protein
LAYYILSTLGLQDDVTFRLSKWDPNNKKKYLGDDAYWNSTQDALRQVLIEKNVTFTESAFSTMNIENKNGSLVTDVRTLLFGTMQEVTTSLDENAEALVYVYPNPVVSTLYVNGISENETLSVFNLSGKCVIKTTANEVNVNELPNGTYLLQLNNQCVKFIKH